MRDEMVHVGIKKQARSNKQQGKATQHTQGSHFFKGKMSMYMYMYIHVDVPFWQRGRRSSSIVQWQSCVPAGQNCPEYCRCKAHISHSITRA